ncbi:MAG: DJ-1/PfpI family protein [Opitutales bacterium]|nr:DJ-1/PfpI family protein [Opitutales bacterium]
MKSLHYDSSGDAQTRGSFMDELRFWIVRTCLLFSMALAAPLIADSPRLLVLLEPGFNGDEFFGPSAAFEAAGYELVIASSQEEKVPLRLEGDRDAFWDVPVDLAISEVNPDDYVGLFVPGGHSPRFLEKDDDAVAVTQAFLESGKPLGMVCHGPRILVFNDLMGDRTWTGLFSIADELADQWIQRPGRYIDQAVVRDGNLVTARYPRDMNVFSWAFLEVLAEKGGIAPQPLSGEVVLVLSNYEERWGNWHFFSRLIAAVEAFGVDIERAGGNNPEWIERVLGEKDLSDEGRFILALDIHEEDWANVPDDLRMLALEHPLLVAGEGMRELLREREVPTVWLEERRIPAWTQAVMGLAKEASKNKKRFDPSLSPVSVRPELKEVDQPTVFLAMREGFYDESFVAWVEALQATGLSEIALVADETGEVTGRNGLTVEATLAHADVEVGEGSLVVAPGFIWPQHNEGSRQTEQPAWLEDQEARDAARVDWLLEARENGATLFLTSLDALRVGRMEIFEGKRFSASEQSRWAFGRSGARYTDAPVTLSAERLITVRHGNDAAKALELLSSAVEE